MPYNRFTSPDGSTWQYPAVNDQGQLAPQRLTDPPPLPRLDTPEAPTITELEDGTFTATWELVPNAYDCLAQVQMTDGSNVNSYSGFTSIEMSGHSGTVLSPGTWEVRLQARVSTGGRGGYATAHHNAEDHADPSMRTVYVYPSNACTVMQWSAKGYSGGLLIRSADEIGGS